MFAVSLKSYAKINIGLRILKKREDGYHDLETIFYPVKLHDEIQIEIEKSDNDYNSVLLKSNKSFIPLSKDNLCYKAVELFFNEFKIKDCFKISLNINKYIPVGGGLGGGSSNAAAIIKFLVKHLAIDIDSNRKKILQLALSIGSDVPFFLMMKPCYAGGRGEKMIMLNSFQINYDIFIVNPNLHVSTKWAFERLNFSAKDAKEPVLDSIKEFSLENAGLFVNDFEATVFRKHDELRVIKEELMKMGAVFSSMSGTGATMYAFFDKNKKGTLKKCREYYNSKNYFTYVSE